MRKLQILAFLLLIVFSNCQKDDGLSVEEKQQQSALTATDYALVDRLFNDIIDLVDEQAKQQPQLSGLPAADTDSIVRNDCITVQFKQLGDVIVFPATLSLNFGTGCTLPDGRTISGQVIAVFTEQLLQEDMRILISYEDLVIDGFKVQGEQEILNEGINENGHFRFRIQTTDGLVTREAGKTIEYRGTVWRSWVAGANTNYFRDDMEGLKDDVWEIIGYAEGFNSNNISYNVQMDDPVRRTLACRWQITGELVVKTGGLRLKSKLTFGPEEEPECDNIVILTAGTYVEELNL